MGSNPTPSASVQHKLQKTPKTQALNGTGQSVMLYTMLYTLLYKSARFYRAALMPGTF